MTSIVSYFLYTKLYPKSLVSPNVPIIKAPAGQIKGAELKSKVGLLKGMFFIKRMNLSVQCFVITFQEFEWL